MANHIKIRNAPGVWSVRAGGAVLAESAKALELSEGDYPSVIYFPMKDIAMALLDKTDHSSHCPHKGDASYYSIASRSKTYDNAAWYYADPLEDVARIKDYIAFYANDAVTVEQL
jgi:uncharacterized protein (DUF427 family)